MNAKLKELTWLLIAFFLLGRYVPAWGEYKPLSKEEQAKVDQAINRGVKFLKSQQIRKGPMVGMWLPFPLTERRFRIGYSLMPALALLESGVATNDPVIQRTAALLRREGPSLDWTYEMSLAILILDRLNQPQDKELLERLVYRLIAGQCRTGGWTYRCPMLSRDNEAALSQCLQQQVKAKGHLEVPKPLRVLTIFQQPSTLTWTDPPLPTGDYARQPHFVAATDNSNTQFAMLALWAARRHGIPMEPTLRLAHKRFQIGFLALSREIDAPTGQMRRTVPQPDLYFLWSVERIAALYNLDLIGDKDWYRWGVEILVTNQTRRGEWPQGTVDVVNRRTGELRDKWTNYGPAIHTSFALLFLKRSNLTKDLTAKLPYKPEDLNKGIIQAAENPQTIPRIKRTSSQDSRKSEDR